MAETRSIAEATVWNIRRNTRKKYSAEEKIRVMIERWRATCRSRNSAAGTASTGAQAINCRKTIWKAGSSIW
jgi:hypothetical protein